MSPLDEILAAAGIPNDHPTRVVARRDGHRVVTRATEFEIDMEALLRRVDEAIGKFKLEPLPPMLPFQREWLTEWMSTSKPSRPPRFIGLTEA